MDGHIESQGVPLGIGAAHEAEKEQGNLPLACTGRAIHPDWDTSDDYSTEGSNID